MKIEREIAGHEADLILMANLNDRFRQMTIEANNHAAQAAIARETARAETALRDMVIMRRDAVAAEIAPVRERLGIPDDATQYVTNFERGVYSFEAEGKTETPEEHKTTDTPRD